MERNDPLRNFRFRVDIDGITRFAFSELMVAERTIDVAEYREGTDPPHLRKLSGLTKYGNITLKWGLAFGTGALDLFKWHDDVSSGQVLTKRKKVTIIVQDEAGNPRARYLVSEAWPMKYDVSDFSGKGNEVLVELLELANEGVERVQ
jgi:phage tail-like protein